MIWSIHLSGMNGSDRLRFIVYSGRRRTLLYILYELKGNTLLSRPFEIVHLGYITGLSGCLLKNRKEGYQCLFFVYVRREINQPKFFKKMMHNYKIAV